MSEFKIKYEYPRSDKYEYESRLERINLDKERIEDLSNNNGFIVSEPTSIKKDVKDPNGIFSTRYGQTLQDINPFADRYKCECGNLKSRIHHGVTCPICGTKVKYVDDNFAYFGWICLKDPYYIIHPNLFKSLQYLIGTTKLDNIICPVDEKDQNGYSMDTVKPKDEPYYGLGLLDFMDNFNDILDFYLTKSPDKKDYYDDILANKNNIFIQSIPVYTTHLRPYRIENDQFYYEGVNAIYNMMTRLAASINKDNLKIFRKKKPKNKLLYDLQCEYNDLYKEQENIISGKRGSIRTLFGGRMNFSARCVITPNPELRVDEVRLPYKCLIELLQQTIINILQKSYNISYSDAYKIWYKAQVKVNPRVWDIIEGIINDRSRGLGILINRNPTIQYGGILQMYVVGVNVDYTMDLPLQVLDGLGADFDGDTLNILEIINRDFLIQAERVLNPRNAMFISKNDGMFNNSMNQCRDTLINSNTVLNLSRDKYSIDQLEKIKELQMME